MTERFVVVLTAQTMVVLAIVGIINAARNEQEGTAVLFALILLGVLGLARPALSTGTITLRRDLASWLERTSATTAETPEEMANRAVSRLRAGFGPPRQNDP
ncbi:MAG: hypothetical protein ACE5GB_03970 [Acidimicrobiales bacterium]